MEVQLPGGLLQNGSIERKARFHALTGRIEQSLIEAAAVIGRSRYVTTVLSNVLDRIGDMSVDSDTVANLCVADRQYLMLRLGALLDGEQMWLEVGCGHCDAIFDVDIKRADLPVKQAGEGFPLVTLHHGGWEIEARAPTGADQERIAALDEDEAMRDLLRHCICTVNGAPPQQDFVEQLSQADIEAIDEALDEVSPAVCDRLQVTCPECGREQLANLDHYVPSGLNEYFFYDEIHMLASHYHWSEADILDLPQDKRRRYIDLISRSGARGQH
jgi:hypothetical protein